MWLIHINKVPKANKQEANQLELEIGLLQFN
jgi:hypothetical protein